MRRNLTLALLAVGLVSTGVLEEIEIGAASYEDEVLADKPFAYFRFNETEGTQASDSSGNNHHGEYVDGVELGQASATKGLGTAALFDGESGFVQLDPLGFESDQLTIETWVNLEKLSSGCCTSILSPDGWEQGWLHYYNLKGDANIEFAINGGGPNNHNTDPETVPFGKWVHIASVYDKEAALVETYVNGQAVEVVPPQFNTPQTVMLTADTQIAAWQGGRFLGGSLDEFAIYDSALSADRVQEHYFSAASPDFNEDGIVDTADYQILKTNFHMTGTPEDGDLNLNGTVDFADFVRFRKAFLAAKGTAAAVPEPSARLLLIHAIACAVLFRSRSARLRILK